MWTSSRSALSDSPSTRGSERYERSSTARRPCGRRVRGGSRSIRTDRGDGLIRIGTCRGRPSCPLRLGSSGPRITLGPSRPRKGGCDAVGAMLRNQGSTGRERAVGTHFPMLAADIAAAALAARRAARFKPGFAGIFRPGRDSKLRSQGRELRSETATDTGSLPRTPTLTHGSGQPTRLAGLGSGSTRTSSAMRPGNLVRPPGWHCCD